MHGYDTYDYGWRGYYAAVGRFTMVDPLAEKYYGISLIWRKFLNLCQMFFSK